MALTRVSPALFQVSNNITSVTVGGSANTISLTFDSNGVITGASNNAVSVANTAITGNIISSQITSVANTQITGNIASSQITSNPTLYGNVSVTGVIGVGGATPTTNGSGITFPASQSASTNANTLDDYEEGSFTPALTASSGSVTYGSREGRYTKVGNMVTCTFWIQWTGSTLSGSPVIMSGLPFSNGFDTRAAPSIRATGFASAANVIGGWVPGNTTYIQIQKYSSGGTADVAGSDITGGGEYGGTLVYQAY